MFCITRKNISLFFLLLSFVSFSLQAKLVSDIADKKMLKMDKAAIAKLTDEELNAMGISKEELFAMSQEPALSVTKGDLTVSVGGNVNLEYDFYNNMFLLNKNLPDQEGFFKEVIELSFDLIYGEEKFGHRAFQLFFELQSKNKWGFEGSYKNTNASEINIPVSNGSSNPDKISLGYHDHRPSRPYPWFKDAWMQFTFNSIFNIKDNDKLQFFKMGWFPYHLSNGIALGDAYNLSFEYLARFMYGENASAPGINLYGQIIKDRLSYNLYYAKFEDKSVTLDSTYNNYKENLIGRSANPWRGVGKDDELWSASITWNILDSQKNGKLIFNPYILYNEASDQYLEQPDDCRFGLGTYGMTLDYTKGRVNFGGEVDFNFGQEKAYALDRNKVKLTRDADTGYLKEVYSDVYLWNGGEPPSVNAPVTTDVKEAVYNSDNKFKDFEDPYTAGDLTLVNINRIRPEFKNDLKGWAGILYGTYEAVPEKLKISLEFGHASGDDDTTQVEENKKNHSFIGIHEVFYGKKVYSLIVLAERSLGKAAALRAGQDLNMDSFDFKPASQNSSFTDLTYLGLGLNWTPKVFENKYFELDPSLLFYWTDKSSYKYIPATGKASETEKASNFLGTEVNIIGVCEILDNLTIMGIFALFFPGTRFKDMKDLPLYSIFNTDFPLNIIQPILPNQYIIGDSTATFASISLTYKF